MKPFRRISRQKRISNLELIGHHYERYRLITIVVTSLLLLGALALCIYWNYDEYSVGDTKDYLYLACHIFNLVITAGIIAVLILNKYKIIKAVPLAIIFHIYVYLFLSTSLILSILDLSIGLSPISFYLACVVTAGIFLVETFFFNIVTTVYFVILLVFQITNKYPYFSNLNSFENYIYFVAFIASIMLVNIRRFTVVKGEYRAKRKLEIMTYQDELTGLLNERSYLNEIDLLNKEIEKGTVRPFAIMVMDVNNLKATNDRFGHRFGCSLIVHCGEVFPTVFTSSKMYHFGGDEFIVVVQGKDYENFADTVKKFEEKCSYSTHVFENETLIYSVAMGYGIYQKGMKYHDVFQIADNEMYKNKVMLKEKYNLKGR